MVCCKIGTYSERSITLTDEHKEQQKTHRILLVQGICNAVLSLAVVGLGICVLVQNRSAVPASVGTEETTQVIESEVYYDLNGKKIYLNDAAYGEIYLPVLADVPACSYDMEQLVSRNGMNYYVGDEGISSRFGIDVSAHQNEIDWETVKAAGVEFAMIRLGYRGYGSGELVPDQNFDRNVQGALAAGIDVGVYFFSQAITPDEAVAEANMAIAMLEDYDITYPVVYDWEVITTDAARTDDVSVETLTDCTVAFCDTIAAAGFTPMVYQNKRTSLLKLDLAELTDYDFWLAEYGDEATFYYHYDMWQYTAQGRIPGIEGDVDLNICFKDYTSEEN